MGLLRRISSSAILTSLVAASSILVMSGHGAALPQAQAATPSCLPDWQGSQGQLPQPPVVYPAQFPGSLIKLNVLQGPPNAKPLRFCYQIDGATTPYLEAPTIVVQQGQTFGLVLVDQIPQSEPTMMPQPFPTAPDGCAMLPVDSPMPAPNATPGYLGRLRVEATPPPMNSNDTNFHTHGWHVSPDVDNVFKSLILSPNGTCTYQFSVPLSQPAGTYWYHAHMHGHAFEQVGGGLAGTLIVTPANPSPSPLPERVVLIKNSVFATPGPARRLTLAQNAPHCTLGSAPSPPPSFDPLAPPSWPSGWCFDQTTAQYCPSNGNVDPWMVNGYPLVAGVPTPVSVVAPNGAMLYRIVDATSDSYANIRMLDAIGNIETLNVVGRDGVPIDPSGNPAGLATTFTNVLLPPGGRVDVVATGSTMPQTIIADVACTGYVGGYTPRRPLVRIQPGALAAAPKGPAHRIPLARAGQTVADRSYARNIHALTGSRAITFTQYLDNVTGAMAWYVTDTTSGASFSERPFWLNPGSGGNQPYLPVIRVAQNSVEEWTLVNASPEIHAFHIHQLTFITESNPFEGDHLHVFQDTVALAAAQIDPTIPTSDNYPFLKPSLTKILIDFHGINKGLFVFHCHMLFHEDHGMMGIIEVY